MARTISFQAPAQVDFTSSNALFNSALNNVNNAFNVARDTVKSFGTAVEDRNQAVLDSYINNINLEDWNKPEVRNSVYNMIKDMSNNSAGMVDLARANKSIDGREGYLLDMAHKNRIDQENTIKLGNLQDSEQVTDISAMASMLGKMSPSDMDYPTAKMNFDNAFAKASPTVQAGVLSQLDNQRLTDMESATKELIAKDSFSQAQDLSTQPLVDSFGSEISTLQFTMGNPHLSPEQRQQASQQLTNLYNNIAGNANLSPRQKAQLLKIGAKSFEDVTKAMIPAHGQLANIGFNRERLVSEQKQAEQANEIAQQRVDLETARTYAEITKEKNSSKASNTAVDKNLQVLGYTSDVISRDKINSPKLSSLFVTNTTNAVRQSSQTYGQFLGTKEANLSKVAGANDIGEGLRTTKGQDFVAHLSGRTDISDEVKIEIHRAYVQGNLPTFDRWFDWNDDVGTIVDKYIETNKDRLTNIERNKTKKAVQNQVNMLSRASAIPENAIYANLLGYTDSNGKYVSNNLPDSLTSLFPKEAMVSHTSKLMQSKTRLPR